MQRVVEVQASRDSQVVEVGEFCLRRMEVKTGGSSERGERARTSTEGLQGPVGTGGIPNSANVSSLTLGIGREPSSDPLSVEVCLRPA